MLKKERVDADADQTDRETGPEIEGQTLGLQPRGRPLPQRLAWGALEGSLERNRTGSDARKSQSQLFLLRLRSCQSWLEFESRGVQRTARRWARNLASEELGPRNFLKIAAAT